MVETLILIHAFLGGVALLAGLVALIARKGKVWHVFAGRIFFYAMLSSVSLSIAISLLPGHFNSFLTAIGVFSLYLILAGFRAVKMKSSDHNPFADRFIAVVMVITGAGMIVLPTFLNGNVNIVLTVFGAVGIVLAARDLILLNSPEKVRKKWLKLHLSKMVGGYIAAFTAFIVVNEIFNGIWGWFVPSIFGVQIIIYWMVKLK